MINDEYRNHRVFSQLLEYTDFYNGLAELMFPFVTQGISGLNIDTYVFSSIAGTLESIKDILAKGRINDSYALLRKYYDSTIINIYTNLYLSDNFSLDNFVVKKIDNWVKCKEQLPEYRIMIKYIKQSRKLNEINDLLYKDETYKKIRNRCNDHTHYNYYHYVLLNDNEILLKNREDYLNILSKDLQNIFILHFAYLFSLNDHYMMSTDYVDSRECGLEPEEDSQYFVAPFIQDIFNSVIKVRRMDIADIIKNNTSMQLE